ncbi:MAG: T9SS type A sorting domain-containing protein [Bacteroidia bacterium]|nr:T9SS type A sorting domain-containing protein [Bacteroidia bacterium]MDW8302704.1 T9SS type A sorting domain-containing protein [Bacteroidia bacterium]
MDKVGTIFAAILITMKKVFYILLAACSCILTDSALAQAPTITSGALPSVGDFFNTVEDTNFVVTMTAPSSTAQSWTYLPSTDKTRTTNFVSPSGLPGSTHFPAATMAVNNTIDSEVVYLIKNPSGLYIDGFYHHKTGGLLSNVPIDFAPKNSLVLPTPITYGSMGGDTSKAVVMSTYSGTDVKFVRTIHKTYHADAFGSLTIPTGTYPNTLRVKENTITLDTVYIKIGPVFYYLGSEEDTLLVYHWLQNAHPAILLSLYIKEPFSLNQSESAEYNTITSSKNTDAISLNSIKTYPNPVQNVLHLNLRENKNVQSIRIVDVAGKTILNENIAGYDVATISMAHYPAGVYIYQLYDNAGRLIHVDKFVKQ